MFEVVGNKTGIMTVHQHKAAEKQRNIIFMQVLKRRLFGDHSTMEADRISSLKSCGQALEQERCFPDVFCDDGDAPGDILCHINGHVLPHTSCLRGTGVEVYYNYDHDYY